MTRMTVFLTSFLILTAGAASAQSTGSFYTSSTAQGDQIEIRLANAIVNPAADLIHRP